jgi:hypothetical protein
MRAVAVNVGANTNEPGFRGPVDPDGGFEFVPIPESEPADDPPTYGDLGVEIPPDLGDVPVHLDPEFAEYPRCERYTYGDPWPAKAGPLLELEAGDLALFYATLAPRGEGHPDWVTPEWGAYVVGVFELARDPLSGEAYRELPPAERRPFRNNAHVRRREFDARVLLLGSDDSRLLDVAVPLSDERGVDANPVVTDLSADSGRGPWWRRPLRFEGESARRLAGLLERWPDSPGDPLF